MKEYTLIETIEVTTIRKSSKALFIRDHLRDLWIKLKLNADDVNVLNRQVFERELP